MVTDARKIEAIAKALWIWDGHEESRWPRKVCPQRIVYSSKALAALLALQELEEKGR